MIISNKVLRYSILATVILGALLTIIATSGNYWRVSPNHHSGLWTGCIYNVCGSLLRDDALRSVQAFMVLSCLGYLLAFTYVGVLYYQSSLNIKILAGVLFATCLFEVIGLSVYTDRIAIKDTSKYGWTYGFGWASLVVTLCGGVLCLVDSGYSEIF